MKKLISVLLVVSILCSFASLTTYASSDTKNGAFLSAKDILSEYVDIDEFGKYVLTELQKCESNIDISSYNLPPTSEVVNALYTQIFKNTPEAFHASTMSYSHNGVKLFSLVFTYECDVDEYNEILSVCEEVADEMLLGIVDNDTLSDAEKALLIHDRLAVWCEYDTSLSEESHDMQRVFVDRIAVCDGYTSAYIYLLSKVGIESEHCSSQLLNHAWNIVYIDGKPYHTDVTWDDKVEDISGRVDHENFLRSTAGIIETGHNADDLIDFNTNPNDTTYDNYYWQNSNTEIQLVGNDIYYIDNFAATLNMVGDSAPILSVYDTWHASSNSSWVGNFSRLAHEGEYLYYSTADAVYVYNHINKTAEKVFEPDLSLGDYFSIYGMTYENGYIICNLSGTPNFDSTTKATYSVKKLYPEICEHCFMQDGTCENCYAHIYHNSTELTSFDTSTSGDVLVPLKIDQEFVKTIGASAFKGSTRITSITLPDSVNKISSKAFENCTSLKKIILHDNVTTIAEDAFKGVNKKKLTFVCYKGSPASEWAKQHDISVEYAQIPYGNVDGSNSIDILDLVALAKYIVGTETYIDTRAANVNAPDEDNRAVDIMDLVALAKYICGSETQLGPQ